VTVRKRFERQGKRWLRSLVAKAVISVPVEPGKLDPDSVSRVLVVRQDSRLGNLVLMTPFLEGLRDAFPTAKIECLVSGGFESVLQPNPHIDGVIVFDKKRARINPLWYVRFVRSLRGNSYDVAVDVSDGFHLSFNNALLTALSGARFRVGYDREDAMSFENLLVPKPPRETHMADALMGLARFMSSRVGDYSMQYYLVDDDRDFADNWLRERKIVSGQPFALIHPGGRGLKQWGANKFAELIDRLKQTYEISIVVVEGPSEKDIVHAINTSCNTTIEVLRGVSIGCMAAVIGRCSLFISNDTGPMHVASALKKPTIGIFTSSDYRVYGPRGEFGRTVVSDTGSPTVEDVMVAVDDLANALNPDSEYDEDVR